MRLRNKKTGKVVDLSEGFIRDTYGGEAIQIKPVAVLNKEDYLYYSLAELNEEWEDYVPAEPLIKDEKVRKAVRAWAEANNAGKVEYCTYPTGDCSIIFKCDSGEELLLDFSYLIDDLINGKTYTIGELCGEEEE